MSILLLGPDHPGLIAFLAKEGHRVVRTEDRLTQDAPVLEGIEWLISYGYRHIFKPEVIQRFRGRIINLHISFLPWNRGVDPNQWSFLQDTPKGVTIHFIDEGIDLGLRIAHLPDSSMQAILVGQVRQVCCASPGYIAARGAPESFHELGAHDTIATSGVRPVSDRWSFEANGAAVSVPIHPRLVVNSVQAALDAAIAGGGIVRLLSYQSAVPEAEGRLVRVLDRPPQPPVPVHIVHPAGRHLAPKARLFIDRAVATLREKFAEP